MRAVNFLLLGLIVVILSVIAVDLHRVARALEPAGAIASGVLSLGEPSHETKEQRVQRSMREQKELRDELDAGLEATKRLNASRR